MENSVGAKGFEFWHKKYERYVRWLSYNLQSKNPDMAVHMDAEDLYAEGLMTLYICYEKYIDLDAEEFGAVVKRSMWRSMVNAIERSHTTTTDDKEFALGQEHEVKKHNISFDLYIDLQEIKRHLKSPISKAVLNEMMNPSDLTLYHAEAEMKRRACVRSQGKKIKGRKVNVPKEIDPKQKHICKALKITPKQMDLACVEIRKVRKELMEKGVIA